MFEGCEAHSLDLSSFDTSKVTDMQCMFAGCKAHSLDLSSFNTRNVTDMRAMFCECKAQIKINDHWLKNQLQKDRQEG
jgi:surface protein